jgi:hypothetical protein
MRFDAAKVAEKLEVRMGRQAILERPDPPDITIVLLQPVACGGDGDMELTSPAWRKSSYSGSGVNCVEAGHVPGVVLVRDTTQHGHGPVLRVTTDAWRRFIITVK